MAAPTFTNTSLLEDSASFHETTITWGGGDLLFTFASWCPTGTGSIRINPAGANIFCERTQIQAGATDWASFFYVSAATLSGAGISPGSITYRAVHDDGGDYGIITRFYEISGAGGAPVILQESTTGTSISESGIAEPDDCLAIQFLYAPKTSGVTATASNSQTTQYNVDYDATRQIQATRSFGDVSGAQNLGWSLSGSTPVVLLTALFYETLPTAFTAEVEGYRWRNDDGSETTATWRQSQDTADTVGVGVPVRLRTLVNFTGDPGSTTRTIQVRRVGDSDSNWETLS